MLFAAAVGGGVEIDVRGGTARFPSLRSCPAADVEGSTLEHLIDDEGLERPIAESGVAPRACCGADGQMAFPMPAQLARARKRRARYRARRTAA